MSAISEEQVRASLKQCMDPEIPISIVDLGLIYDIDITEKNDVNIKMTMTTKGCPLHETMVDDVKRYTRKVTELTTLTSILYGILLGQWIKYLMKQKL
jgi:metal-sulfur cluster biosynthetic enzyme